MLGVVIFIHIVVSMLLVLVVLMQSSKGGGLAGAFGGGSMSAAFGGRGAGTFLSRVTTILAVTFMLSCLAQVFISKNQSVRQSILQQELSGMGGTAPATNVPGFPVESDVLLQNTTTPPDTSG